MNIVLIAIDTLRPTPFLLRQSESHIARNRQVGISRYQNRELLLGRQLHTPWIHRHAIGHVPRKNRGSESVDHGIATRKTP